MEYSLHVKEEIMEMLIDGNYEKDKRITTIIGTLLEEFPLTIYIGINWYIYLQIM